MKLLRFLTICVVLALLLGCARDRNASCVVHGEAGYELHLPSSGEILEVAPEVEKYLPYVTDALVQEAEEKISNQIAQKKGEAHFWIAVDGAGYLCLMAEQIIQLTPPSGSEVTSGCGIDHDHLYFQERISNRAL